jgi:hypothetical protein
MPTMMHLRFVYCSWTSHGNSSTLVLKQSNMFKFESIKWLVKFALRFTAKNSVGSILSTVRCWRQFSTVSRCRRLRYSTYWSLCHRWCRRQRVWTAHVRIWAANSTLTSSQKISCLRICRVCLQQIHEKCTTCEWLTRASNTVGVCALLIKFLKIHFKIWSNLFLVVFLIFI